MPVTPSTKTIADLLYDREGAGSIFNIAGASAGVAASSTPKLLRRVIVNTKGSASTLSMWDNATTNSGTKLGVIDLATLTSNLFPYDVALVNGLWIIITGTLSDVTFVFDG